MIRHATPHFSNVEGTHSIDGLWVPTNGVPTELLTDEKTRRRPRLVVPAKALYGTRIAFEGTEMLGADDQSVFLAICAQAGANDRILIEGDVEIDSDLARHRAGLLIPIISGRANAPVISVVTSFYRIARDAGMAGPDKRGAEIRESLRRLQAVTVTEIILVNSVDESGRPVLNPETGEQVTHAVNSTSRLLSYEYDVDTKKTTITINPRQTNALLGEQKIQVSLSERRRLTGEVPKLLHFWLCAYVRLGAWLGVSDSGASIDKLVKHIWNEPIKPEGALESRLKKLEPEKYKKALRTHQLKMNNRRRLIIKALTEIKEKTSWEIEVAENMAYVRRPLQLPLTDQITVVRRRRVKPITSVKADGVFDEA